MAEPAAPTPQQGTTASSPPTGVQLAGLGLAGAWLIFLIIMTVTLAVVIFGATQFQARIATLSLDGGPLTVWKAEQLRAQWSGALDGLETARTTLRTNQQLLPKLIDVRSDAYTALDEASIRYRARYLPLIERIATADNSAADRLRREAPTNISVTQLSQELQQLKLLDPEAEKVLQSARPLAEELLNHQNLTKSLDGKVQSLEQTIKNNTTALATAQAAVQIKLSDKPGDEKGEQRIQIENAIYEFQALQSFAGGIVYRFALAPSDILTLLLVIAMGVLGSSLLLSYIYITEFASRPTSFYLFRPFLGIITAVVIFIVAKAGVPIITDTSRFGGNAPINPFFISFLAIISGFLSERALETLKQVASNYFREPDVGDRPRWARENLRSLFQAINRDPVSLAQPLGVKPEEINEWIDGKKTVPSMVQTVIASVLNKPKRELFTDMPPDGA